MFFQDVNSSAFQIRSYEPSKILIYDFWQTSSFLVTDQAFCLISASNLELLSEEEQLKVINLTPELLVIGLGHQPTLPDPQKLLVFYEHKIGVECMNNRSACHTFSVLSSEHRRVALLVFI